MKTTVVTLLFACSFSFLAAQSVTGSGEVVEQARSVGAFTAIEVSKGVDLFIRQGNSQQVVVKADDNLVDLVSTEVDGQTLRIRTRGNMRRVTALDVYVTVTDLERIEASSGSDVKGESKLELERLALDMSSGSDLELDIEARELTCRLSGGSDADLSGEVSSLEVTATGGSDLQARDLLVTGRCILDVSSASDAFIRVEGELEVEASGASDVTVKGNPTVVRQRASGGSDIRTR